MRLFKPFSYLLIKHSEKRKYDFLIPAVCAFVATSLYYFFHSSIDVLGERGLIDRINALLVLLAGFFIAALAAVSTFNSEGMDKVTPGKPFILVEKYKNTKLEVSLTRRRFLSLMFGYLSVLTILIYFFGLVSLIFKDLIYNFNIRNIYLECAYIFIYIFAVSNLFTNTLIGIYYMSYRIHKKDPRIM